MREHQQRECSMIPIAALGGGLKHTVQSCIGFVGAAELIANLSIQDIDVERRRLGYFHNAAYYGLEGEDFEKLFRVGAAPDPTFYVLASRFCMVPNAAYAAAISSRMRLVAVSNGARTGPPW